MSIEILCRAIKDRHVVSFTYKFEHRVVEPYSCFTNDKNNTLLWSYQTSGIDPHWRNFNLQKISNLVVHPQTFAPRTSYKRISLDTIHRLHCQL